jgi:hypothetical protein
MTGWAAELPLAQVRQAHGYQRQQAQSQNKKTRQPLHNHYTTLAFSCVSTTSESRFTFSSFMA